MLFGVGWPKEGRGNDTEANLGQKRRRRWPPFPQFPCWLPSTDSWRKLGKGGNRSSNEQKRGVWPKEGSISTNAISLGGQSPLPILPSNSLSMFLCPLHNPFGRLASNVCVCCFFPPFPPPNFVYTPSPPSSHPFIHSSIRPNGWMDGANPTRIDRKLANASSFFFLPDIGQANFVPPFMVLRSAPHFQFDMQIGPIT